MEIENKEDNEKEGNIIQKAITSLFIFYNPKFSDYKQVDDKKDQLVFIQKEENDISEKNYIPCMLYRNEDSSNFLICFHGNSEDIFTTEAIALNFRSYLKMNVLFVEYPRYSIYFDSPPESKKIYYDSIKVYEWVKKNFHVSDNQIFIYGRSLGTSPAIYLASKTKPKALFLVSAFTSMKDIGTDKFISYFFEEIFNSNKYIKDVMCSILLIHGEKDTLINIEHSKKLEEIAKKNGKNISFVKRHNMSHSDFDMVEDVINPIKSFLELLKSKNELSNESPVININRQDYLDLFIMPNSIQRIIQSKCFNIEEFSINMNRIIQKDKANHLIKLLDKRVAVSNGLKITIYDDRRNYKEDYTIDLCKYDMNIKNGIIECMSQLKNGNLICSTTSGYIFMFQIGDENYKKIEIKNNSFNHIIHKIEVLKSNKICLLSKEFINIYNDNFFQISPKDKSLNTDKFTNFIETDDDCLAFLSDKLLMFYKLEQNELHFTNSYQFKQTIDTNKIKTYNIAGSFSSLIFGYGDYIYYFDEERNEMKVHKCQFPNGENITCIYPYHDELFLAGTNKGNIVQIILGKEDNPIKTTIKSFNNYYINEINIKSLLLINIRNILMTCSDKNNSTKKSIDKICILESSEKKGCEIF